MSEDNGGSIYSNSDLMNDIKVIKEDNARCRYIKRKAERRGAILGFFKALGNTLSAIDATMSENSGSYYTEPENGGPISDALNELENTHILDWEDTK